MRGVRLVYQFSLLILVGLVLWNFGSGAASAQVLLGGQDLERSITAESLDEELENLSRRTTQALDRGGASSEEFYALRRELIELRERAVAREAALSPIVGNIERRLDALGPPPEEGAAEDAPTGGLRADLSVELDRAKAPVLAAQDAARRIDGLVAEIDWEFLARISAPLVSRYPLPILPGNWVQGLNDLQKEIIELANVTVSELADPTVRRTVLERLPIRAVLLAAGLALVITLRRWLNAWIDAQLNRTRDRRSETLLVALRGINRIVLPTAGALLLFAALDPAGLAGGTVIRGPLDLPNWVWALIGAGWLSGSLFAPRTPSHRIPPFDDATARQGAKLVMALGVVLALGAASL